MKKWVVPYKQTSLWNKIYSRYRLTVSFVAISVRYYNIMLTIMQLFYINLFNVT